MNRFTLFATVFVAGTAIAIGTAMAGISGSAHDFRGDGWYGAETEICLPCHTPHGADTSVTDAPLWNHTMTANTVFTPYSSSTLTAADVGDPSGASKLCLSCHDGSTALDSYGGATGTSFISGGKVVGSSGDLSAEHPISFTFDDTLASNDGGLFTPSSANSGLLAGGSINADMLIGGKMECASCHDVHNGADATAVNNKLLVKTMAASALCTTCHNK